MAFGQQSGPPASARQVQELLTLLKEAGHTGFRGARGPMGFTQRQGTGKFTRDEADAFIAQLLEAERVAGVANDADGPDDPGDPVPAAASPQDDLMRRLPAERLALELRRRGWTVIEP
jgi:hypothetical protein